MARTKGSTNKTLTKEQLREQIDIACKTIEELRATVRDQEVTIARLQEQLVEFNQWKERLKLGGRKEMFGEAEKESIRMYAMQGKSMREIAKIYDCSVGKIHKVIHEK
jgi:DNA-directed RNA polymerase specialized sigma24 family protein